MFNQDKRQIYHSEHYGLVYTDGIEHILNANGVISGGKEVFIKDIPQNADTTYAKALLDVLNYGAEKGDRTGTGTKSLFGYQMRFNLLNEFPLLTTKKIHWKSVVGELLWFLSGCKGGVTGLQKNYGVTIWNEWQSGKIAYSNMVKWGESDLNQLALIIAEIKTNPDSRRLLVSNWNPKEVHSKENALDPCHVSFQFYVCNGLLSCHMYQRSADAFLGVPFNIASYALLTHMVAKVCGLHPGELIVSVGDLHIYNNHLPQVKEQLSRCPKRLPTLKLADKGSVFQYGVNDIELIGYEPHKAIKGDVAV
jgi:thymidylate synthase